MAVESYKDLTNYPFWLSGRLIYRDNETILTNAGRTTPLKQFTLMAQVVATGKWVPLTDVTATTGAAIAKGVYVGDDITAAALVAGDVTGCPIVVGGDLSTFDGGQLIIENSVTLATVVGATTVTAHRVSDDLARIGLYAESVVDIENFENAP